jgi:thioesterase domain-containing protein
MKDSTAPLIFLSGAGGKPPDLDAFRKGFGQATRFEVIDYPGWKLYVSDGFSTEVLVEGLVEEIAAKVPQGPIHIVGLSIGGHFAYAAALRLEAMGREIGGFCAIDTFMIGSTKPSTGWKRRALAQGLNLLRGGRLGELLLFLRSKFWRALVRLAGGQLPGLLRGFSSSGPSFALPGLDPIFEDELSMRLLIEAAAPWVASLDREPVALNAPAILLRTNLTAADDAAWRRRCPNIEIVEIPGQHHNLFEPENVGSLCEAFVTATRGWR